MENDVIRYDRIDPQVEARVDDLLRQMTLDEKVCQLVMVNPYGPQDWEAIAQQKKLAEEKGETFEVSPVLDPAAGEVIRQGKAGAVISDNPGFVNRLQHLAVDESRLGIPLLIGADVIHGLRTIFPIPLGEACTWNPELLERASRVAAAEASTQGINWIYAPMVDIARDPRWGRIAEGAGEDPFLGRAMAEARVRGFQSSSLPGNRRISACPKHYAGYGCAESGKDYNTAEVSERTLREVYLPPFKAAYDAGAGSTMSAFQEIGGVPITCNTHLLRTILRDEWGWQGVLVSDYNAIAELVEHGVATDLREAARLSILAGVDMDMNSGAYLDHLASLVEDGEVPVEILDQAVRRVLRLKINLGLFEQPYVDETLGEQVILQPDARALALEIARQSMVLLKNDGMLPLDPRKVKVALVGPLADNRSDLLGSWSSKGWPVDVETVLEGFQSYLPEAQIIWAQGCPISGDEDTDITASVDAAQQADVVVAVVGESAHMSGEAHSRAHLGLPGRQQELVDALSAVGKPLAAILMCGRPLVVPRLASQVDALLVAWQGGIRTGQAAADLVFGKANPSGKLTASWPRAEGQIPVYYNHKPTGRPAEGKGTTQFQDPYRSTYLDEPNTPLFAFGHGLSYSRFSYSPMEVLTPSINPDGVLKVRAFVQNSGDVPGDEVVQLYIRDRVAWVTRPVKELKGFRRVHLEPGAKCEVVFEIPGAELGFVGLDMKYRVEPGKFSLWIGPDSTRGEEAEFEIVPA